MTSLEAQNQFGMLIDKSQRQPVTVTRRGRPVAVVLSFEDYQAQVNPQSIPWPVAALISQTHPLRGKEAVQAMREHLASMSSQAEQGGLTEANISEMLNSDD
jgi:prevent-host-death family protein